MKQTLLNYFLSTYSLTGWAFYGMKHIRNKFGHDTKDALNELFKEGYIRKRPGGSVDIVELIKKEKPEVQQLPAN